MPDLIDNLPVDETPPSPSEIQLVNTIFKEKMTTFQRAMNGMQDVLLVGLLFIVFSLPLVDPMIIKFFPSASTSPYILLGVKTAIVMLLYFCIKNLYLVRK